MTPKTRGHFIDYTTGLMCKYVRSGTSLTDLIEDKGNKALSEWFSKSSKLFRTQIVPYLIARKLKPIATQFPVSNVKTRVGTRIDLVCQTESNQAVVFELKIGYSCYYDMCTTKPMGPPFYFYTDAPKYQHLLYLVFATDMMSKKFKVDRKECAVLRITPEKLHVYHLPPWSERSELIESAWMYMENNKDFTKTERKRDVRNAKRRKL